MPLNNVAWPLNRWFVCLKPYSLSRDIRMLTNPKSKSKSRLTAGFLLKSNFPTTFTHPPQASHPGKVSKKQDTVIYPNQKLLVYIMRLWNMFWNWPRPKNHWLGVKKCRKNSIQDFFNHVKLSNIYRLEADMI